MTPLVTVVAASPSLLQAAARSARTTIAVVAGLFIRSLPPGPGYLDPGQGLWVPLGVFRENRHLRPNHSYPPRR